MTNCCPRPPMRWNVAIGVIARCKRVFTVSARKIKSKPELHSTCGEKPKAKGVSRPFMPCMRRGQDECNPMSLLQSQKPLFYRPLNALRLENHPFIDTKIHKVLKIPFYRHLNALCLQKFF